MGTRPPVWIVNLKEARERRAGAEAAFTEAGVAFEFVEGVDGSRLTRAERSLYSRRRALFEMGRELSQGMFGCSLSHLNLYQRMCDDNVPVAAIFEDDARPQGALSEVLKAIDRLPRDWDVVTLHSLFSSADPQPVSGIDIRTRESEHAICTYRRGVFGTQGYLIKLEAASRVLEVAYPVAFPPDEMLFRRHPAQLTCYGIEPSVLRHDGAASEVHARGGSVFDAESTHPWFDWSTVLAGKVWRRLTPVRQRAVRMASGQL